MLKKFKITPPHRLLSIQAPEYFETEMAAGTPGCTFSTDPATGFDSIHWFVHNQAEVNARYEYVMSLATPGMSVWVYYPKRTSGLQTDLARDNGWEMLMAHPDVRYITLNSFNDTWSAFCLRKMTAKDLAATSKPKAERPIFQYADSATKTITLPDDVQEILNQHPAEKAIFDALAFSHRREYVEWIVSAKRAETRQTRLTGLIEKLRK